jgi:ribosome-associated toxin RatA of RatAB toxin-antitoxin module
MSVLNYNYKMIINYSFNEIWTIIKNPNNYKRFIDSCENIKIIEKYKKNNLFYYKATITISTPIKYINFDCVLKQKSNNEIILYNLKNDYIDNFNLSWNLSKINDKKTTVQLNFELLFYSYTIQLVSIYSRYTIINNLLKNFLNVLYKTFGKNDNSLNIVFKEIQY